MASSDESFAEAAAVGAFHLFTGKLVSRVVGLLGGIAVIRMLGLQNYGILNVALVLPGILALFGNLGIHDATTKYLAEHGAKGDGAALKAIFRSSLLLQLALVSVLTTVCYFGSEFFASITTARAEAAPLIRIAALLIPGWTLYAFAQSALVGLDATKRLAMLMIIQEALGAAAPVLLIVYGLGITGALVGNVIAFIASAVIGVMVALRIAERKTSSPALQVHLGSSAKRVLTYGIPLGISGLISAAGDRYFGFLISLFVPPAEIGGYNAAAFVVSTIAFLTLPLSTVMLPLFSRASAVDRAYGYAVKYSSVLILPAAILLTGLAGPLSLLIFGSSEAVVAVYVSLLAAKWLAYGLGGVHYLRLFAARGETKLVAKLGVLSLALGALLGAVLIPVFGILGLILSGFLSSWPSYFLSAKYAKSRLGVSNAARRVFRLYLSGLLMLTSLLAVQFLTFDPTVALVLGVVVSLATFIFAIPLVGAMNRSDIDKICRIVGKQPIIGGFLGRILSIMKSLAD